MKILAIETSCDETAAAVIVGQSPILPVQVLGSVVASSEKMHINTGGIVPEVASREQTKSIIPVIQESIKASKLKSINEIDAIAVTVGPGLIGSLLVGVETAKGLAYVWDKPVIAVNHLVAHLYANFVDPNSKLKTQNSKLQLKTKNLIPEFPAVGLIVSGGHTDLVWMEKHGKIKWLGGTRDDAAGECFDKAARMLGLPYPGGPAIAAEAAKSDGRSQMSDVRLPRPLLHEDTFDFSFSGLKTAVSKLKNADRATVAYELQEAVTDALVAKLTKAVDLYKPKSVLLGGGVAANQRLREKLELGIMNYELGKNLYIPPVELCTDNAVSIGAAGYFVGKPIPWQRAVVDPGLAIG